MPNTEPDNHQTDRIHVAVGVIFNRHGQVLITRRAEHIHQGGLWEFPGGKLEIGETVQDALKRELKEELGITVNSSEPLIRIHHDYADKRVLLDVWRVTEHGGEAQACEGQPLQWINPVELNQFTFPAANQAIISAVCLPPQYMITGSFNSTDDFIHRLDSGLKRGLRLVQLRLPNNVQNHSSLIEQALERCHQYSARVILNADVESARQFSVDGVHLTSQRLMQYRSRPIPETQWLAASVHNESELIQARKLNTDFIVISPVQNTTSHPDALPLGWSAFSHLAETSHCPVYALGGMNLEHLDQAIRCGAQGIAAISELWGAELWDEGPTL